VQLCKAAGISCNAIIRTKEGICVKNFTNHDLMLEQADASGRLDSEDFTDNDIVEIFGDLHLVFSGRAKVLLNALRK